MADVIVPASQQYVLASSNAGKLAEFSSILGQSGIETVFQSEFRISDAEETGKTFEENALIKARHACRYAGIPAIADDSGLEVAALGGRPGVYSARYAGGQASDQDNIDKLLSELEGVHPAERSARFTCVIALVQSADDTEPILCTGHWDGQIALYPAGNNGFGYDPVFYHEELGCTSAELTAETKNQLSHRAAALRQLQAVINNR